MHNPAHPGEVLRDLYLEPLGLSVTEAAAALGVSRKSFSELINGRSGISPQMALRLEKAFGSTAEHWLTMQQNYDLWQVRRTMRLTGVRAIGVARRKVLTAAASNK
jgi:addiction module HigA family antidote